MGQIIGSGKTKETITTNAVQIIDQRALRWLITFIKLQNSTPIAGLRRFFPAGTLSVFYHRTIYQTKDLVDRADELRTQGFLKDALYEKIQFMGRLIAASPLTAAMIETLAQEWHALNGAQPSKGGPSASGGRLAKKEVRGRTLRRAEEARKKKGTEERSGITTRQFLARFSAAGLALFLVGSGSPPRETEARQNELWGDYRPGQDKAAVRRAFRNMTQWLRVNDYPWMNPLDDYLKVLDRPSGLVLDPKALAIISKFIDKRIAANSKVVVRPWLFNGQMEEIKRVGSQSLFLYVALQQLVGEAGGFEAATTWNTPQQRTSDVERLDRLEPPAG